MSGATEEICGSLSTVNCPSIITHPSLPGFYYFPPSIIYPLFQAKLEEINSLVSGYYFGKIKNVTGYMGYIGMINLFPGPVQEIIQEIISQLIKKIFHKITLNYFNTMLINRYLPGQGIGPHIDPDLYSEIILCISIGGPSTIRFSQEDPSIELDFLLESNSIYIMSGDARYKFKHSIIPRTTDIIELPFKETVERKTRYALTFRHLISKDEEIFPGSEK